MAWMTGSAALLLAMNMTAFEPAPSYEGRWYDEEKRMIVEIKPCENDTLCGEVVWIGPHHDNIHIDTKNRDPELRGREMLGAIILHGYEPSGHGWRGGKIYNPRNGRSYASHMQLEDDGSLLVKGCVGPICKGLRWTAAPTEISE